MARVPQAHQDAIIHVCTRSVLRVPFVAEIKYSPLWFPTASVQSWYNYANYAHNISLLSRSVSTARLNNNIPVGNRERTRSSSRLRIFRFACHGCLNDSYIFGKEIIGGNSCGLRFPLRHGPIIIEISITNQKQ
jgi:hypothetical protein